MDPIKEIKWVFFILIILWIIWYFTGGPQRYESINKPYIKPAAPIDTGELYGDN